MPDALTLAAAGPDGGTVQVRLSSPDKVVWPATDHGEGITKADLAAYLGAVAGPMLRGLADRPVTLQRVRGGIEGEEFYSKNPPKGVPAWSRTTEVTYPSGRRHPQLVVDDEATLLWTAQMGTVTWHPWPVRSGDNDHPDELRIDLDPQPGRAFADVVEAALGLREVMLEAGLTPFAKTTGSRGVHVFAPVRPELEFLEVRHAVIGLARELERRMPDLVTTAWWKEERGERIFVDFNQATRDRTLAAAWSPRILPGAPVSVPVTWDELVAVRPTELTVHTVPGWLAEHGDAWEGMHDQPDEVAGAYALWQADLERGLGELSFPPDHPKMPGEPPRVQPSKKVAEHWDEQGNRVEPETRPHQHGGAD
ncbi:non-homologous end-joining DNA ligase [Ornithinimicrobium cerasi]|uniref:DNA ligase D n=1 Tax=Ornithinimicrobium cerasi TaxID=2248773 RepID=A0A285VB98_9MICO|nr:non-homologous end-joining DNA ligase [Ornithinimicrobium cerasi]SOC51247.1 DNA ligase D [Ornithinimicrobium cerasi]